MTIKRIENINAFVAFATIDEYLQTNQHSAIDMMLTCCGFMSTTFTQAHIDQILQNESCPEEVKKDFYGMKPGPVIFVLKDVADALNEKEFMAILYHEQSHIENNDTDKIENDEVVEKIANVQIRTNREIELRADKFAASKVGAEVIRSALIKVVEKTRDLIERISTKEHAVNFMKIVSQNPDYIERLNALTSLRK